MQLPDPDEHTAFPPRNSQGRPVVPRLDDPSKTWTMYRPSSYGKLLLDDSMIEKAYRRKILRGAALKPAIAEQVVPLDLNDRDEKRIIDGLVEQAGRAGGDGERADLGTSMHGVLEKYLTTGVIADVAPKYRKIRDAMIQLVVDYDIQPVGPEWVEPFLINYDRHTSGSPDLVGRLGGTMQPAIFDLKTGKWSPTDFDLPVSQSIQTYLYASSTHRWDGADEKPKAIDIDIDQSTAYIIWAPLEGETAQLFEMNLEIAAELTDVAEKVRGARRKQTKDAITRPVPLPSADLAAAADASVSEQAPDGPPDRDATGTVGDSPEEERNMGSDLSKRIGAVRRRLNAVVEAGCPKDFIGDLRKAKGLPRLDTEQDQQTESTLDEWESLATQAELGWGVTAVDEDRIEQVIAALAKLDRPIYAVVEAHAKAAGVPHLKQHAQLKAHHLDCVEQLISKAIDGRLEPLEGETHGPA